MSDDFSGDRLAHAIDQLSRARPFEDVTRIVRLSARELSGAC